MATISKALAPGFLCVLTLSPKRLDLDFVCFLLPVSSIRRNYEPCINPDGVRFACYEDQGLQCEKSGGGVACATLLYHSCDMAIESCSADVKRQQNAINSPEVISAEFSVHTDLELLDLKSVRSPFGEIPEG